MASRIRRARSALVPVALLALQLACGEDSAAPLASSPPSPPTPSIRRIRFGESIDGDLGSGSEADTAVFSARAGQPAVVLLQVSGDPARARVWNPSGDQSLGLLWAGDDWGRPNVWSLVVKIGSAGDLPPFDSRRPAG